MTNLVQTVSSIFKKAPSRQRSEAVAVQPTRDRMQEAAAALNFWQALEYLAPQSPPPVRLTDSVWALHTDTPEAKLPWIDPTIARILDKQIGAKRRFQLFAGVIPGATLIETVRLHLGADPVDMSERMPAGPVACVVLDLDGAGIATGQVFVSTVPWAVAKLAQSTDSAERLNFRGFFGPGGAEVQIRAKVRDLLVERHLLTAKDEEEDANDTQATATDTPTLDDANEAVQPPDLTPSTACAEPEPLRPVTPADVSAITDLVFQLCGWRPSREAPWHVQALLVKDKDADKSATQDDPLNSFYAEDLERVSEALDTGDIGVGLSEYLRGEDSQGRIDLERQVEALIDGVHPSHLPPGCWPAAHPLVSAQQFAVNMIMRELGDSTGLFSVNGPPGTGKTTLLKDIVAAVVVKRADALVEFEDPLSALKGRLDIENYAYPAYELDERLRGFGIVVSSANNGAVENITKELPGLKAIAEGLDIDYFSQVADSVAAPAKARKRAPQRGHWGLVTAVLGNKSNRNQFANRFWLVGPANQGNKSSGRARPVPPRSLALAIATGSFSVGRAWCPILGGGTGLLSESKAKGRHVDRKGQPQH